jgi:hypothetical protein
VEPPANPAANSRRLIVCAIVFVPFLSTRLQGGSRQPRTHLR